MLLDKFKFYLLRLILFCFVVGGIAVAYINIYLLYKSSKIGDILLIACLYIGYPAIYIVLYGTLLYGVLLLISRFVTKRKVDLPLQTHQSTGAEYLFKCKENYYKDITPSNPNCYDMPDYKKLIEIANDCIKANGIEVFAGYFQEGQYFVDLWTAHIIIQKPVASDILKARALEIISDYSTAVVRKEVANEEKEWLNENRYSLL